MLSKLNYLYITRPKSPSDRELFTAASSDQSQHVYSCSRGPYSIMRFDRAEGVTAVRRCELKSPTNLLSFAASESAAD